LLQRVARSASGDIQTSSANNRQGLLGLDPQRSSFEVKIPSQAADNLAGLLASAMMTGYLPAPNEQADWKLGKPPCSAKGQVDADPGELKL